MGASLSLAVLVADRQRVIDRLSLAGAVSADRAIALPELTSIERESLAELLGGGVVCQVTSSLFYVDEAALEKGGARTHRFVNTLAICILIAVAALITVALIQSQ